MIRVIILTLSVLLGSFKPISIPYILFLCTEQFYLREVDSLECEMRLKTGFFETKLYDLQFSKGKLKLSPNILGDKEIVLLVKEISYLQLKNGENLENEVNTLGLSYQVTITDKGNYDDLLSKLKANLNIKISREYEGGN